MSAVPTVVRNTWWNLLGFGLPIVVALFTMPPLIHGLGPDRFGLLALGWVVLGYFSLFDLGVGKATTKYVSEYAGRPDASRLPNLVWNSLYLHLALGLSGGITFALLAPWLTSHLFKIPEALRAEALAALYWLASSIPVIVATSCLRSVMEALQRFDLVNLIKIPANTINYLVPLLVLYFTHDVASVIAVISLTRIAVLVAHLWLCFAVLPKLNSGYEINTGLFRPLLGFGGWVMVSSLVAPVIMFADRFFIASLMSIAAVTYYATPYEIVTKLWLFSGSLLGALFPVFSALGVGRSSEIRELAGRASRALLGVVTPIVALLLALGRELLLVWVGPNFAALSTAVTKWLAVGVLINVLAQVPYTVLQSTGRPALVAQLQLIQLPLYLLLAWYLLLKFGNVGVAMAWTFRSLADLTMLVVAAERVIADRPHSAMGRRVLANVAIVLLFLAAAWSIDSVWRAAPGMKLLLAALLLAMLLVWEWHRLLDVNDRRLMLALMRRRGVRNL